MIYLFLLLIGLQFHSYDFTRSLNTQKCKARVDIWPRIIPYNADFAFNLYKEMSSTLDDKNILFSPLSISTAFAMLSLGARSKIRNQIYRTLAFNLSEIEENEIHNGFCQLIHKLNLPRAMTHLKILNALFLEESLEIQPKFLKRARNFYQAEDVFTDFLNPAKAQQQINNYVKHKTYGKTVYTVKDLSEHTRMVLVNYIFFKDGWRDHFHPRSTSEGDFLAYGNTTVKLNMMEKQAMYRFFQDEDLSCSAVEVPYSDNIVAWFILPDKGKLKDVERSLVKEDLDKWRISSEYKEIHLRIPKFSISASSDIKDLLQGLGLSNADLSGITRKHNLTVTQALHEAVLVVQEDYTEMGLPGSPGEAGVPDRNKFVPFDILEEQQIWIPPPPPPPPLIEFNRPFLIIIIDSSTGIILLMGKIVNPTKQSLTTPIRG